MKREIKFRVWDKENNYFRHFDGFFIRLDGSVFDHTIQSVTDEVEVMQYTGLKDKNGNEIYDGDIIRYEFKTGDSSEEFRSKVFWDEFMWVTNEHSLNRISKPVIVGNIYDDYNDTVFEEEMEELEKNNAWFDYNLD